MEFITLRMCTYSRRFVIAVLLIMVAVTLAACSGRGDDGGEEPQPQPTPAIPPQLSIGIVATAEGNSGVTNFVLTVTSSAAASSNLTATFTTADGTATAGSDYTAGSGTLTIAAGSTAANITIAINGDAVFEADETFTVTLTGASGATLGTASAIVTIINDDAQPAPLGAGLNDTGVTTCSNGVNIGLGCNSAVVGTDVFPGQDAEHGRDVTTNTAADGHAGFSFTKLDANGVPLPDQSVTFSAAPWHCVLDNVTGLLWEVKSDDGGLRDKDWRYSWFDSSGVADGGDTGRENLGVCVNSSDCDTEKYREAVNAAALCGRTDWRLPVRSELLSIIHYGSGSAPFIDVDFFPQSVSASHWSGSVRGSEAWAVSLLTADALLVAKDALRAARLVSDGGGS
ncbi:MAG TPA: DUF1566 domain-containing protein [Steroidobacteraceae bacterium]|nr:DUF1566 domain-containing protein [Steroidobacteraceae bacterium]